MKTITEYLQSGLSATEMVKQALARAKQVADYNSFLSLTEERALKRAAQIDSGEISGKLAGVPFVVKDNMLAFGAPTTAASVMLKDFHAPLQATAVEKLEAEGAICIGKSNLDAFAHGGSTENSAYGVTKNAHDTKRVAGGSSGGSAVITALDVVPFALGTDTGGSIRQPASFNGVVGIKPTYGTVSRYGVVAMASSTDTIGCFTHTAADADVVMGIMAGRDANDMTTLPNFWNEKSNSVKKSLQIGLIKETMGDGIDTEVQAAVYEYAERLKGAGHTVREVSMPTISYSLGMYYVIVPAEISSNLARYDGVRYGYRSQNATSLEELYGQSRDQGFEMENKRRIMIGSFVLSSGFFDAYYQQAQKARALLCSEFDELFASYDLLLSPVSPTPAFAIGQKTNDPIQMYKADIMTVPASLAGLPAVSVPAGVSSTGLPIGAQLIGPQKSDRLLLRLAAQLEKGA